MPAPARSNLRARPRAAALAIVVGACLSACATENSAPASLLGTWDLVGFTDMGIAAQTTGTVVFRADGTVRVDGTITFPGEPTEPLVADGTFVQAGDRVTLSLAGQTGSWALAASGNEVTLTEIEPPPANTITLRRR